MITVFTPTYNRDKFLERLYNSLIEQTFQDFEWVVIDDGSIDLTEKIIKGFIKEDKIKIKYVYQSNSGKHIAINLGAKIAEGELFFFLDSDDFLKRNALQKISDAWDEISNKEIYLGVAGCKGDGNNLWGTTFENKYLECTTLELRYKYGIKGDKAEAVRVDLLKKYPFPHFKDEKFLTEDVWWNYLSTLGYKMRYFNEIIYFCKYLEDGLTNNYRKNMIKNIKSTELYYVNLLNYDISENQKEILLNEYLNILSSSSVDVNTFTSRIMSSNISSLLKNIVIKHKGIRYKRETISVINNFNLTRILERDFKDKVISKGALYGGGEHTERLIKFLPRMISIDKIFDKNPSANKAYIEGIHVEKLTDASINDIKFIIISSEKYEEEIFNEIKEKCGKENIFLYRLYEDNKDIEHLIYGELYLKHNYVGEELL